MPSVERSKSMELEEKYFKIAEERIEEAVNDLPYRANRLKKNAEVADYDK